MNPFRIAKRTELIVAEIYKILARLLDGHPELKELFKLLASEEEEHARRVERWARVWNKNCPERHPRADIGPLTELARRAAAFGRKLNTAELVEPSAALGLAICLEQKLNKAHEGLLKSEMGALFLELRELDDKHLGLLLESLAQADGMEDAPELPCDAM